MNQGARPEKLSREELADQFKDRRELNIALGNEGTEPMSNEFREKLEHGSGLPPQR